MPESAESYAKAVWSPFGPPVFAGEQVQPGHSKVLALGCSITDFTLATNAQGAFQRMMRFALIQADLGSALHIGIQQPIDDKECPFDPAAMANRDTSVSELCKELGIKPVTLYRYVDPNGNLRDYGKRVLSA